MERIRASLNMPFEIHIIQFIILRFQRDYIFVGLLHCTVY